MDLIGWKSDIERVDLLYTSLLLQSAHEMARLISRAVRTWRRTGGPAGRLHRCCPYRLTKAEA